jgi:hypothetical protein
MICGDLFLIQERQRFDTRWEISGLWPEARRTVYDFLDEYLQGVGVDFPDSSAAAQRPAAAPRDGVSCYGLRGTW